MLQLATVFQMNISAYLYDNTLRYNGSEFNLENIQPSQVVQQKPGPMLCFLDGFIRRSEQNEKFDGMARAG